MLRCLQQWFSSKTPARRRANARRSASFRPVVEALEDRRLLSTIATITDRSGITHTYLIDAGFRQLVEVDSSQAGHLSPSSLPSGPRIHALSAGLDPQGQAVVYAQGDDGSIQERSANGSWFSLGNLNFHEVIGSYHGAVWALGSDGNVYYSDSNLTPGTWLNQGTPNGSSVSRIRVGTDAHNMDQVFAIGSDSAIYVLSTVGVSRTWQLVNNSTRFQNISATQDNQVYALDVQGQLHQDAMQIVYVRSGFTGRTVGLTWWRDTVLPEFFRPDGTRSQFTHLSAGTDVSGHDMVYALDQFGGVVEYSAGAVPQFGCDTASCNDVCGGANGVMVATGGGHGSLGACIGFHFSTASPVYLWNVGRPLEPFLPNGEFGWVPTVLQPVSTWPFGAATAVLL
jgi:hypothetical protein